MAEAPTHRGSVNCEIFRSQNTADYWVWINDEWLHFNAGDQMSLGGKASSQESGSISNQAQLPLTSSIGAIGIGAVDPPKPPTPKVEVIEKHKRIITLDEDK